MCVCGEGNNIELHGLDLSELRMLKIQSPRVDIYLSYPLQLTPEVIILVVLLPQFTLIVV